MQVSDREYQAQRPTTQERLRRAQELIAEGRGDTILFRCGPGAKECSFVSLVTGSLQPLSRPVNCRDDDDAGTPVSATRFSSLAGRWGDVYCCPCREVEQKRVQVKRVQWCRDGDDDFFSSDFSDEELQVTLGSYKACQMRSEVHAPGLFAECRPSFGQLVASFQL